MCVLTMARDTAFERFPGQPSSTVRAIAVFAAFAAVSVAGVPGRARAANWPTFDGNASRSAWLNSDHSVNRGNVKRLHRKWVTALDAVADSTPIFVERVSRRGQSTPMLFQTDGAGTTYGIEAATGTILWRYKTSGPNITASTPVLDPSGSALYVPAVDGYVHKLDAASGTELSAPGFPAQITLSPQLEKDASPLNVANGYLYAATSGYLGDAPPYDGHVVTVRLSDGTTNVFNSLCSNLHMLLQGSQCSSVRSGIWARAGVVIDPDSSMNGRAYFATGNGPFVRKQYDYGDSVVALSEDGSTLAGSFTPTDYAHLSNADLDLGSTAPAMLPTDAKSRTPLLAVQGGKGQVLYLLDRTHLAGVGGELQHLALPGELYTAPAVWRDEAGRTVVFLGLLPDSSEVMALTLQTDANGRARLHPLWTAAVAGTSPVALAGLVVVAASGVLSALDARNGNVLWQSTYSSAGGTIGSIHWESPIVVDGAVYVSDGSGNLSAYAVN
jgi:outer membrane protein assembly factor BamB